MSKHLIILFHICILASLSFAQISITLTGTTPASVDNTTQQWFPPIVDQGMTEGCGNATGIGYIFNHELSASRNVSSKTSANQYPFYATFAFLNSGDETSEDTVGIYHKHFLPAWRIAQENGIPSVADYGTNNLNSTRWMTGYDKYYTAMKNRVDKIDSLQMTDSTSLKKMKQWLYDHGNGSSNGGIFTVTANIYCVVESSVASGEQAGSTFVKGWGWSTDAQTASECNYSTHAMAIVGYDDNVKFDYNGDGKYTNTVDINSDGKVTMADMEIGAFKVANTWGTAAWDNGLAYGGYRLLFTTQADGGTANNNWLYYITVKKDYSPKLALKVNVTNSVRNNIALSVGVAQDPAATVPTKIRRFQRQFTYSGGALPMCGKSASSSIETGFDISDLLDSISDPSNAKFFLIVDSKGGTGTVDSLSLMDYRSGTLKQTKSAQTNVSITAGTSSSPAKTYVGVSGSYTGITRSIRAGQAPAGFAVKKVNSAMQIQFPLSAEASVSIIDMRGKSISFKSTTNTDRIELPGSLPVGIYIVTIRTSSGHTWTTQVSIIK